MTTSNVLIHYKPQLYADLFARIFQSIGSVEVREYPSLDFGPGERDTVPEQVDVIVLSLDDEGQPDFLSLPEMLTTAKMLAISPSGENGYRLLPGQDIWEEIHPFGLEQLIDEVVGSEILIDE